VRRVSLVAGAVVLAVGTIPRGWAQLPETPAAVTAPAVTAPAAAGGVIRGAVKAGTIPLPGVGITATNTLTGKKYATTTDVTGAFMMAIPRNGRYVVKAELAAFASVTQEALINASSENGGKPEQVVEFGMQLASRVAAQEQTAAGTDSTLATALGRGLQSLSVTGGASDLADASAGAGNAGVQMPTLSGLGGGDAAATDSVAVSGQMGQTNGLANFNEDEIRQRVEDAVAQAQRQGGAQGDMANAVVGMLSGMMGGGGFGGLGGGGRGGGRGGGGGGFRGFNPTQPHGAFFYQGGNGALNATNFSLNGAPVVKPSYTSNRFGVSFTGSPSIPGLVKASTKQFIFFNLTGQRNLNPTNLYGTVPTLAQRGGDFSQLVQPGTGVATIVPIYDPTTGAQFNCNGALNVICAARLSAQAKALLAYYPAPNVAVAGTSVYNYQTITTAGQNSTQASLRFNRNFGQATGFGGRGGGGGGGGRSQQTAKTLRQSINFNGSYSHSASDSKNLFALLGGSSYTDGYGATFGYTVGYGRITNNASLNWNRAHTETTNYFTNTATNPAALAGVSIPSQTAGLANPQFYNGVPNLTITGFTGANEITPRDGINQTISFSDFVSWSHKKHNMRFGVDIRRLHADSVGGNNVVGTFVFSGYSTQSAADQSAGTTTSTKQAASGSGFADYLLGLPQQTKIQAGLAKIYLRANVYDWYAQDDWRLLSNVTLNLGLRYEYFSPYVEKNNRLVNLDHTADFSQVAPVVPNATGPYGGSYPRSLVNPDRTMYSPRLGIAWRPKFVKQTVVRAGYGINYNTGQFATFAQSLAFQPPFAVTQTNVLATTANPTGCTMTSMTLAQGFGCSSKQIQNNYAVNKDYRLGNVQVWNMDIQRTLPMGIVANVGYTGSLGGNLDMVRAPNHTTNSVTTSNAQAFTFEDSIGFSRQNSLTVNVRKRLQKGVSLQATYTYGHSIDNASSIGGGAQTTAQNDQRLDLEAGNSAFDVRHKVNGNWILELPFGPNRAFLTKDGFWSKALDGFSLSGDYTFASGTFYTPRYSSTSAQIAAGGTYTLRPDRVFNQPIAGAATRGLWFNKAAFTAPANGYGTASRNSIAGPGTVSVNMSLSRTVALGDTRSFEARLTAANALNTVQYSGIDTTVNSPTFGLVTNAASMRQITLLARYRF
jgi:hypothetical protein